MVFSKWQFRAASLAAVLLVWTGLSLWVNSPKLLPGISFTLFHSLPSIAAFGGGRASVLGGLIVIGRHALWTVLHVLAGGALGILLGVLAGLVVHFFRESRSGSAILLAMARAVPLFALLPLFLFWFGGREIGVVVYIGFCVFVVMATNTYEAACNVQPVFIWQARLLGATRYRAFMDVYLPAIGPEMMGSLRNVVGLCWAFSLGAEYLTGDSGLGYLVFQSYLYADMGKLLIFMIVYGLLGVLSVAMLQPVERFVRRWSS